jgi:hypothetical protein
MTLGLVDRNVGSQRSLLGSRQYRARSRPLGGRYEKPRRCDAGMMIASIV